MELQLPQQNERSNDNLNINAHRSLLLHNPAMILTVNLAGIILEANPAAELLTGYRMDELIGVNAHDFLEDGQEDSLRELYQNNPLERPIAYVARIVSKSGAILELGVKNVPIIIDGQVVGMYCIARDITESNRIKEMKNKAEQELRDTVRYQQGMTFKIKRIDGQYVHTLCDGELLYRLGYTPDQVIGKTLWDFLPPETVTEKQECYDRAWAGEEVVYEGNIGETYYLASLRSIRKDGIVHEVIGSCVDITERKKTERQLMEAKEQFEALFISSPTAIDLLDRDGRVVRVNPAHERMFGWTNEELSGKPTPVYPDHRQEETDRLSQQLLAGTSIVDFETERVRKDGKLLTVCLTVAPIRGKEGQIIGFTNLTRDITESKKTEEMLRKADKLNVVGQLAAGLAHEIRNPLTSLRGFLQLLRAGHREKEIYYDLMLSELDRINTILGELLIIAKPQVTLFESKMMAPMLQEVLNLLEPQAMLQNIQFRTVFGVGDLSIYCSGTELKQVFINIIKNGMEAMPAGGILSVELKLSGHSHAVIRITDQGAGIPEDRIPRLGEPFYTTKEKGTGLGLMMCYKIIEAHKGSIVIRSKENVGTTVEVMLPRHEMHEVRTG